MGDPIPFRRGRRWQAHARRRGEWSQFRIMVWAGLLLGLLAFQATRLLPGPEVAVVDATAVPPDPYAEGRRSRAILEAQEGAPPPAFAERGGGSPRVNGTVRVIDGDTFVQGGIRVRIADIDTPEIRGRCVHETELATRATRRMRALLSAGAFELHRLPEGRDEDQYGRKLRIVTRGGQSLGDVLVAEGLARTWTGRREPWC